MPHYIIRRCIGCKKKKWYQSYCLMWFILLQINVSPNLRRIFLDLHLETSSQCRATCISLQTSHFWSFSLTLNEARFPTQTDRYCHSLLLLVQKKSLIIFLRWKEKTASVYVGGQGFISPLKFAYEVGVKHTWRSVVEPSIGIWHPTGPNPNLVGASGQK